MGQERLERHFIRREDIVNSNSGTAIKSLKIWLQKNNPLNAKLSTFPCQVNYKNKDQTRNVKENMVITQKRNLTKGLILSMAQSNYGMWSRHRSWWRVKYIKPYSILSRTFLRRKLDQLNQRGIHISQKPFCLN